ncbi:MAG: HAMP domain-containing histidine kinase [Chloroflexota bacterium]|nr:HAMP domain-containing histidine kinase [Chloroflexota bacterium]
MTGERPPADERVAPPWARRWHGERPPWWPEGQAWPPERRHWRSRARGLAARIALTVLAVLLLVDLGVAFIASLIARALGLAELAPGAIATASVALFVFLVLLAGAAATWRRAGLPLTEVLDAIGRVAEGDYSARVDVRGPRGVRRLVAAFNEMVERLATADERRRRLLADVTHELRTPLAVIQGQLEGVVDGVYPNDEEHVRAILDETRHMARIVEDLRTLSVAESGALALAREPVAVAEAVDDAIEAYRAQARAAGVTLAATVPDALAAIDADPTRLRQVLENLVSNALRYTPRGGRIDVAAARAGDAVAVSVSDTGRGMSADELARAFERFQRSADSSGSGLGLAIARDLVRAHGGEIAVASEGAGRGTTVRCTWPVAR